MCTTCFFDGILDIGTDNDIWRILFVLGSAWRLPTPWLFSMRDVTPLSKYVQEFHVQKLPKAVETSSDEDHSGPDEWVL